MSKSTGNKAMIEWDATWRDSDIPIWISSRLRAALRIRSREIGIDYPSGLPSSSLLHELTRFNILEAYELFDHTGTIGKGRERPFVSSPYWGKAKAARIFADLVAADLEIIKPGIWHPETTTFVFRISNNI